MTEDATYIRWFNHIYKQIPGVRYHSTGEATCDRFLSRKDNLVHMQNPSFDDKGLALALCGLRYNIYRRPGVRGLKGIPTDAPVTCLECIILEPP